jgi:putative FmdB family regulatory protein
MPLYAYKCKSCSHSFDTVQSIKDDALTECPDCTKLELQRIIGPVGIQFRGTGFPGNDMKYGTAGE